MAGKRHETVDPLLPTVSEPGTYSWCEEVVECMNAGWTGRELGEQAFLAAVRAALAFRIWETLSPPPPQEPFTSLANLIRRTAAAGQAESMQLVIKFSGLDQQPAGTPPWTGAANPVQPDKPNAPWSKLLPEATEDAEAAMGRRILEEFEEQLAFGRGEIGLPGTIPSGYDEGGRGRRESDVSPASRLTPAQRKREKLAATHPELLDAVQAGEMTLKQAYVEAGIEKQPQTLDRLQKLWRSASDQERERFAAWLQEQLQQERRREFEQDVYGE